MGSNALDLRYATLSDVGKKRAQNEDNFCALPDENFFAVADGMGGHAGGEIASRLAIESAVSLIQANKDILKQDHFSDLERSPVAKLVSDALRHACHEVFKKAEQIPYLKGMGTTTTCLLFHQSNAYIGHVGDSRAYLIRDGRLLQLSEDHSLINEQLKAGLITGDQAKNSRFRNIITRSIGFEDDVDVDMIALGVKKGDLFLLCTDGLTGLVGDNEILTAILENDLERASRVLVDLANRRGGDDNITVVLVSLH